MNARLTRRSLRVSPGTMNAHSWYSQTGLETMTPTKMAMLTRWRERRGQPCEVERDRLLVAALPRDVQQRLGEVGVDLVVEIPPEDRAGQERECGDDQPTAQLAQVVAEGHPALGVAGTAERSHGAARASGWV